MSKHTPGPWKVFIQPVLSPIEACFELSKLAHGTNNFSGVLPMIVGANGLCTATTGCGPDGEANAQLIAAAPQLLESCKRMRQLLAQGAERGNSDALREVNAAIAEAEGSSS